MKYLFHYKQKQADVNPPSCFFTQQLVLELSTEANAVTWSGIAVQNKLFIVATVLANRFIGNVHALNKY